MKTCKAVVSSGGGWVATRGQPVHRVRVRVRVVDTLLGTRSAVRGTVGSMSDRASCNHELNNVMTGTKKRNCNGIIMIHSII